MRALSREKLPPAPRRIRADLLLVERGLSESRARAQAEIKAGSVLADGCLVSHASKLLQADCQLEIAVPSNPYVSRGALKLIAALDAFSISFQGRMVLDLGASTGGFTQVALQRGARHVVAVDVGHGQLHASLKDHPGITLLEGLNARDLAARHLPAPPDVILADLSFISLALALGPAMALAEPGAHMIALIKPQFEAGRGALGKGGIVRDPETQKAVCVRIKSFMGEKGWSVLGQIESPIAGGDGNREYLIAAQKQ